MKLSVATSAVFRVALFAAGASLALYIPYKYATELHAISGLYAYLFPLSGVLAVLGMALSVRPESACDCSGSMRVGAAALAGVWMATGVICAPLLVETIAKSPAGGLFATFHMLVQHVFLSLSVIAFAVAPRAMSRMLVRSAVTNGEAGKSSLQVHGA